MSEKITKLISNMATDTIKKLRNLEINLPYALLKSWTSLTIGQEIVHDAKDYKGYSYIPC